MAAEKEELIFEIDVKAVEQSLANIAKSTNDLKQANKDLAKEVAAGNKEAAAAVERNNAVIKIQQGEYRALQRNLEGYIGSKKQEVDQVNFSNNSIKANRELLKQLTAQYVTLKNPSQQATNDIKRLSDTLKQQEAVIGDTRRNVGNYAQGFKDAIGGIVGGIPGLKGFQSAQLGVNAAMNANPAGAVVLAFQAVVEIFKSNAAVADALTFAVDGLTKGFGFIIDTIVDTVTNFDNLTEAITHPIDFLKKLATGTVNAAKEGYNASKALDEFTVANARTAAAIAENDIQVQALTKSLKDKTKSEQERIKIANQIADIEIKNTELSKKLAQDELAAEQLKLKGRTLSGEQTAKLIELESKVKQAAAEADIVRAQRQTRINILLEKELTAAKKEEGDKQLDEQRKYWEQIDALRDEFLLSDKEKLAKSFDDKLADIKGNSSKEVELRLAIEQEKQLALDKFDADAEEKRKAKEKERQTKLLKEKEDGFNAQIAANNTLEKLEIDRVNRTVENEEEKQKQILQIRLKYLKLNLKVTEELFNADGLSDAELQKLTLLRSEIENIISTIQGGKGGTEKPATLAETLGLTEEDLSKINEGIQTAGQILNSINKIAEVAYQGRLNNIEETKNAEIQAIEESSDSEEEKQRKKQEAEKKAARLAYDIQVEQFGLNKTISIVQAIINTAAAVVSAFATSGNIYSGIALAALAAATGAAQIAVISAQQPPPPPKFAKGVIGLDGAGTETSDSIPAMLSKGESVMTAKATKRFAPIFAQMEMAVGNTPNWDYSGGHFATGVIGQYGDGGSYVRSISQQAPLTVSDLTKAFSAAPAPVVSVREINNVNARVQKSTAVSEL